MRGDLVIDTKNTDAVSEAKYTREDMYRYGIKVAEETLRQAKHAAQVVQHFVERPHIEIYNVSAESIARSKLPNNFHY